MFNDTRPSTDQVLPTDIEILVTNEAFEEIDGQFQFESTIVIYKHGKDIYLGVSRNRNLVASEVDISQLTDKIRIPATAYSPAFPPTCTRAPDPLPPNTYVKKPNLTSYDRISRGPLPNLIADNVLAEVQICERLKQTPHPHIARYLGCQVVDGRIIGICFQKYDKTLMQAFNPRSLGKRHFIKSRQDLGDHGRQLASIEAGLKHLHSLGLVHNDLNPSNIMFEGDTWIIIDFGSCCPVGTGLEHVGRTYEWHDEAVQTSLPQNDMGALCEIRAWLAGGLEDLQFDQ